MIEKLIFYFVYLKSFVLICLLLYTLPRWIHVALLVIIIVHSIEKAADYCAARMATSGEMMHSES